MGHNKVFVLTELRAFGLENSQGTMTYMSICLYSACCVSCFQQPHDVGTIIICIFCMRKWRFCRSGAHTRSKELERRCCGSESVFFTSTRKIKVQWSHRFWVATLNWEVSAGLSLRGYDLWAEVWITRSHLGKDWSKEQHVQRLEGTNKLGTKQCQKYQCGWQVRGKTYEMRWLCRGQIRLKYCYAPKNK